MDEENTHLRYEIAQLKGTKKKKDDEIRHLLSTALAALRSGKSHICEERLAAVLRSL